MSVLDLFLLLGSTVVVFLLLAAINHWVPARLAAIRLSLFSCLLYLSLFLTYGWGIGLASGAMVFGILLYLMFFASTIGELARRISIHDVEPHLAEQFDKIVAGHQALRRRQAEALLKEREQVVRGHEQQLELKINKSDNEMTLGAQLKDISKKKLTLSQKMNETQLEVLEKRIDALGDVFAVVSAEASERVGSELQAQVADLRANVKGYTPEQLQQKMNEIMTSSDRLLRGIPESLGELRKQLLLTTRDLEKQTRLIAAEHYDDVSGSGPVIDIEPEKPTA